MDRPNTASHPVITRGRVGRPIPIYPGPAGCRRKRPPAVLRWECPHKGSWWNTRSTFTLQYGVIGDYMTYHDNRNRHPDDRPRQTRAENSGVTRWAMGGLAALAIILGAMYAMSERSDTVTTDRSAITPNTPIQNPSATRETTGSSSVPQSPPATNR